MPGAFVEGDKKTEGQWNNTDGRFVRSTTSFRGWISAGGDSVFPAEAGRSHLCIAWAGRTAILRKPKGLEGVIGLSAVGSLTVHTDHIKNHYYRSHASIDPNRIVPEGPVLDFAGPHGRAELSG